MTLVNLGKGFVVGMVKDRENRGSNFKTSGQCRLQIALLCCAFLRPVLRRCNMHSALNGNIWSKSDFHPSYIFRSHLIPSAFSQLFNQHMFRLLHHTRSEYQKLTYRFLLQIWQIWYFMVIYVIGIWLKGIFISINDFIFSEAKQSVKLKTHK